MSGNGQRRAGWSCERGAVALGYCDRHGKPRSSSFTKGMQPAWDKLALLTLLDPVATMTEHSEALKRIPVADVAAALERLRKYDDMVLRGQKMWSRELELRYLMATGRLDRAVVHPQSDVI